MLTNENIICFAKEWTEDPTSNNHVMRLLAKDNEVLWLNSIASRTPNFGSKDDMAKIRRKLKGLTSTPKRVAEGLHVYNPLVLPFPHNPLATRLNGPILRLTLMALRAKLKMKSFQLWTFLPTAVEYIGKLKEDLSVYYCTDEWSQFNNLNQTKIMAQEKAIMGKVDVVFTTSRSLYERKRPYNPNTFLASHGVDHEHFSSALKEETPLAPELRGLPKPIIGFFGLIQDWIDVDLFEYLAVKRPHWTIVSIGKSQVDISHLKKYRNIVLIDRRPYFELPKYCKGFDVAICPFKVNDLTIHVNPIKLREYVSAGLPVVSTDIPECRLQPELTRTARTHEEFLHHCEAALKEDSPEKRKTRSDAMKEETWEKKVAALGDRVKEVKLAKERK